MIRYDDPLALPLLLHLNSEPWLNLDAYAAQSAEVPFPVRVAAAQCIALPPAPVDDPPDTFDTPDTHSAMPLSALIARRRSVRAYAARMLPLALLGRLLNDTYGVQALVSLEDGLRVLQRPLPSAGALYPLELHCLLQRVEGVPDGRYRYEPLHHRLEPQGPLPGAAETAAMLLAQPYVADANVIVFLVGRWQRTLSKYGMRGYRYLLLEAGHAAQNLCLGATAAGLGSLCIGGFRDQLLNQELGLEPTQAAALYGVAVGWPA